MNDTGHIAIRPVHDQMEAHEVGMFLKKQIAHPWLGGFPRRVRKDDGTLRPTLIGAWGQDGLAAGAFVQPNVEQAEALGRVGEHHGAKLFRRQVAMLDGLAVRTDHRGEGIGLQIKLFCDVWAAQHHACLMLSSPTTEAARRLNHKALHVVLEPRDALVIQYDDGIRPGTIHMALDGTIPGAAWAFAIIGEPDGFSMLIGQDRNPRRPQSPHDLPHFQWIARATPGDAI